MTAKNPADEAGLFNVCSDLRSTRAGQSNLVGFEFSASMFLIIRPNNPATMSPRNASDATNARR